MTTPTTPEQARAEQERVLRQMADVLRLLLSGDEAMVQAVHVDIRRIYTDMAPTHAALLGAYAEALDAQQWIPVSERLPENEDELVQVATETQKMAGVKVAVLTGYYSNDSKGGYFIVLESINGGRIYGLSHLHDWSSVVTHWHPLPAPPAQVLAAGGE